MKIGNHNTLVTHDNGPALTLYHANGKGTGCAAKFAVRPAIDMDGGVLSVTLAPQVAIGNARCQPPVYPAFDWEGATKAFLEFDDVAKVMEVLLGSQESICDGKGLYCRDAKGCMILRLRHVIEPRPGYEFLVDLQENDKEPTRACFFMSPSEALGLSYALQSAFSYMCFGK